MDDIWNDETGTYEPDTTVEWVYEGEAFISTRNWSPQRLLEEGREFTFSAYTLNIPVDAPEVKEDDIVLVTVSDRHPYLIGQTFIVRDEVLSSFAVSQKLTVEKHVPRRPR